MTMLEYFLERMYEKGLNAKEVAERCGVDKTYMYAVKSGKRKIGEKMFTRLCDALDINETEARERFGDQIAPRGYNHNGSRERNANAQMEKCKMPLKRMTKREENDPAELLINMMHIFTVELNDSGKRVVMSIMKMLADMDAFRRTNDKENEHEPDNEIQDR